MDVGRRVAVGAGVLVGTAVTEGGGEGVAASIPSAFCLETGLMTGTAVSGANPVRTGVATAGAVDSGAVVWPQETRIINKNKAGKTQTSFLRKLSNIINIGSIHHLVTRTSLSHFFARPSIEK